jgi:hypothetical protein
MKTIYVATLSIVLFCSCQSESIIEGTESIKQNTFTDSVKLNYSNLFLKFNSDGLFDTIYRSYYADMCSAPNEFITFSNAKYCCEDSFAVMHKLAITDTMLNLRISQNWTKTEKKLDQKYLNFEMDKFIATSNAQKSDVTIQFQKILRIDKILVGYYGYSNTKINQKETSGLNAFAIEDSILFKLSFYCYAQDCDGKLAEFENILKTICIYRY